MMSFSSRARHSLRLAFAFIVLGGATASLAEAGAILTIGSGFNTPEGVAVDASGNVFVADTYNNAVKKIVAPGYTTVTPLGVGTFFSLPSSVAVDTSGNVYVTVGNAVVRILAAGGYTTVNVLSNSFNGPTGVAVDASGNVFVADRANGAVKEMLAPGYTTINTIGSGFSQPYGVALDASGNVFVADYGSSKVKKIVKAGGYTTVSPILDGGSITNPTSVAVDGSGNVFVADAFGIREIFAPGYTTDTFIGSGYANPQPYGVAVDTSGNVFVADTFNNAIKEITSALAPTITKGFGAAKILPNETTSLTFTVANPNASASLTGVAFTDNLPAGLVVATPNGLTNTCGGTASAVAGSSAASLSGATLAGNASCTMSVTVQGTSYGVKNNSVQVSSTNGGIGNTSNASLTVGIAAPSITKAFGAATMAQVETTSLTFTISNPNGDASLTGVAFTDNLPSGLRVASPNNLSNTCGGTATAVANALSASLSGATLAPNASCTMALNVQATTVGTKNNSVQVTSTEGGTGNTSNASVTVIVSPPSITKVFGASTIEPNGTTSLTFTITNPSLVVAQSGVAFTDNLPAGLVVATPNGLTTTCSGTATAVAGSSSASLSGASLNQGASCTMAITVQGTTLGVKNNSVQVSSTNVGTGNTSNASVTVATQPPAIVKAFGVATIEQTGTTSLTFTLNNPNASASQAGVAFTDSLPAGLVVATPNGLTNTCGGTATAVAGASAASLSGAALAGGSSCTMAINVQGTTTGQKNNSVQVTSTNNGTGNTSNASLTVTAPQPPTITKAFGAATIQQNGTTSLTFTLGNPNASGSLTGIAFTDNLPAGLVVATPNGLTNTCGGTATAVAGAAAASLSGVTLAAGASCTMAVTVQGTTLGTKNNNVQVTSANGGTGNTSNASVTVATLPPAITKAFGVASIEQNGTTSLTFTVNNPNAGAALTGVAFTDNMPAGLVVATPNGLTTTCSGTATAVAGGSSASLSGATLAGGASCTMAVTVEGTTLGVKNNSVQVNSTNGGTGNTSNASLTVGTLPPTIAKAFGVDTVTLAQGHTSLTFTVANPNVGASLTGVAFTDAFPAGLVVATPNGLTTTCGGTATAVEGATSASLSGATLAAGASCTIAVDVQGTAIGVKDNSVQVTSSTAGNGNTAHATLKVWSCARGDTAFCDGFDPVIIGTLHDFGAYSPLGVAVDTGGNVFATVNSGAVIKLLAPAYTAVNPIASGFNQPWGVAIDSVGNVFVGDSGNNAVKEILAPGYTTVNALGSGFFISRGVAVDAGGNVFVADSGNDAVKRIVAPAYTTVDLLSSGYTSPAGIALDASGNVFLADTFANQVKEILAPDYTTVKTLGGGFSQPYGVAVDGHGNVFVADKGNGAVKKILAPGYTTVITLAAGFDAPFGVAVDADGNVFVADFGGGALKVILAPGGHN